MKHGKQCIITDIKRSFKVLLPSVRHSQNSAEPPIPIPERTSQVISTLIISLPVDPTTGGTDDWLKAEAGIKYVFTPELRGPGFIISPDEIQVS